MAKFQVGEFYKSETRILVQEAPIVGFVLILIFLFISCLLSCSCNTKINKNMILSTFISGYIFHVLCEYTGVNVWYSKDYYEIIPNIN